MSPVTLDNDRDKMISENLGLVHSIAHRFTGRGVEYDDLFQSGCVGLIKAVDRFDKSKGFAFSTYAVPVIMGEIKRIFRDDGAIKVSRSLKEKAIKAKSVCDSFEKRELRKPTVSELAEMLGISAQETAEVLNVMSPMLSLNSFGEDGENTIDVPVDESEELFNRICIKQLMMHLEETEKRIVDLRYYKGFTQQKTAEILGVSQVQISRKEKKLLQKLRSII